MLAILWKKLFRVRWWDYTDQPFNLNGRICAESVLAFGVIGVLILKIINPALLALYSSMPQFLMFLLAAVLAAWLIFDIALSLWLMLGVRVTVGTVQRDATDEIAARVHEVLTDKGKLNRRLVKAFPNQTPTKKTPRKESKQ